MTVTYWIWDNTLQEIWGEAFVRVREQGLPVRPWLKKFMNCEEMQHYYEDYHMRGMSEAYLSTMFPDVKGKSPDYSPNVLRWAGQIYCYWIIRYQKTPAYVYSVADIDKMQRVWFEYHSIMNPDAVVWNLEHKVD